MRYLKRLPRSIYFAAMIGLAGCAADRQSEPETPVAEDADTWVSFQVCTPGDVADTELTRATASDLSKSQLESKIGKMTVLIVDPSTEGGNRVVGVSKKVTIGTQSTTAPYGYTVTANLGMNTFYLREHKYKLYVMANLPVDIKESDAKGPTVDGLGQLVASGMTAFTPATLESSTNGLPMTTLPDNAKDVMMYLLPDKEYTQDDPYVVQKEATSDYANVEAGTLILTPLVARLDVVAQENITNFTYPISYKVEENGTEKSVSEVNVIFKKATLKNSADKVYLMPQGTESAYSLTSPDSQVFGSASFDVKGGIAMYVPEYVPSLTDNKLLYKAATYLELDGILSTAGCTVIDEKVKKAIDEAATKGTSSPKLYYYDDGKVQTGLTLTEPKAGATNWHTLSYDSELKGYKVTYRHAVRHDAGSGKNLDDGIYNPQEYGVVRNYIYNIGIASVSALPHPWNEDGSKEVESPVKDIYLKITTPAKWTYHRGAQTITFEK